MAEATHTPLDLVERVARAIASEDGGPGNPLGYFPTGTPMRLSTWEEFMPAQHEAWRAMARAAMAALPDDQRLIEAIRELLASLKAVVFIADRKTDVFDAAHAAIARATEHPLPPERDLAAPNGQAPEEQ